MAAGAHTRSTAAGRHWPGRKSAVHSVHSTYYDSDVFSPQMKNRDSMWAADLGTAPGLSDGTGMIGPLSTGWRARSRKVSRKVQSWRSADDEVPG